MAVSPSNGASAPIAAFASARRIAQPNRPATSASASPTASPALQRTTPAATPGMLVNRADLSEDVVLQAIRERMVFEGRDATKARAVLNAALAGRPVACHFLKRLVLPPPQSALQMPVQSILREAAPAAEARGSWLSRLSTGR